MTDLQDEDARLAAVLGQSLESVIDAPPPSAASATILRYSGGTGHKGKGKGKKGKFHGEGFFQRQEVGQNYICQNCGKKGDHWLQDCPLKYEDEQEKVGATYDAWSNENERKKTKIRWARGIPMNYLQECPTFEAACERSIDGTCYLRREKPGKYFAYVHDASSNVFLGKHMQKLQTPVHEKAFFAYGEAFEKALDFVRCQVCTNLLMLPEIAPCCGRTFCRDCILERPTCPACKKPNMPHLLQPHDLLRKIADKIRGAKMSDLRRREDEEQRRRAEWRVKQVALEECYAEEERERRAKEQRTALHTLHRRMLTEKLDRLERKMARRRAKILEDMEEEEKKAEEESKEANSNIGAPAPGGAATSASTTAGGASSSSSAQPNEGAAATEGQPAASSSSASSSSTAAVKKRNSAPVPLDLDAEERRLLFDLKTQSGPPEIRNAAEFELFKLCLKERALRAELEAHDAKDPEAMDSAVGGTLVTDDGEVLSPVERDHSGRHKRLMLPPAGGPLCLPVGNTTNNSAGPVVAKQQTLQPGTGVVRVISPRAADWGSSAAASVVPHKATPSCAPPATLLPLQPQAGNASASSSSSAPPVAQPANATQQAAKEALLPLVGQVDTTSKDTIASTEGSQDNTKSTAGAPIISLKRPPPSQPEQEGSGAASSSSGPVVMVPAAQEPALGGATAVATTAGAASSSTSNVPASTATASQKSPEKKTKKRKKLTPEEFFAWQESIRKAAEEGRPAPPTVSPGEDD
ncbi:unnamed protein product [Amoebophrya sp. A120]|nr:unnamed protein product [Amoebophrya sp. A120]|eukprot:GSA120T00011736001.1